LLEWIEQWQHASSPTVEYWIIACAINPLAKTCNVTFVNLQHCNLCLSQQTEYIENILLMVNIQHEDDNEAMQRGDHEENSYLELGVWWVTFKDVLVHVKDQGTWVKDLFLLLTDENQIDVLREIATYALRLVKGMSLVQGKHNCRNNAAAQLAPPIFPQHLYKMRTSYFIEHVLGPRREMMMKAWGKELVDLIEQEHRALIEVVRGSAPLKRIVDSHSFQTMFNNAWDALPAQPALNHLRLFCGGLASAFASPAGPDRPEPSPIVLWWPGERLCQHDVRAERLLNLKV
jgi:hypothetical protein